MNYLSNAIKTIPINDLRRKFGEIEKELPFVNKFIITKKGKPFAVLSADPSVKRETLRSMAGALKGSGLDNNGLWRDILKRKSRKKSVIL